MTDATSTGFPEPERPRWTVDEPDLSTLPNPNGSPSMVGEILPDDWTPDADR